MLKRISLILATATLINCGGAPKPGENDGQTNNNPGSSSSSSSGSPNPGSSSSGGLAKTCHELEPRLWRLSAEQIENTVQQILPGAPSVLDRLKESLPQGEDAQIAARLDMSESHFDVLVSELGKVAEFAAANPEKIDGCIGESALSNACLNSVLNNFAASAYRRPLDDEQINLFTSYYRDELKIQNSTPEVALSALVHALLLAPEFQFRQEITVDNKGELNTWSVAENIAYTITDQAPDEALKAAAMSGDLADPGTLRAHVDRLLQSIDSAEGLKRFISYWLQFDKLDAIFLDTEVHPDYDEAIKADFKEETQRFIEAVYNEDLPYETLWTADWSIVNPRLASWYGVNHPTGSGWERVTLADTPRRGILGQGSFLMLHNDMNYTSVIKRGHEVSAEFLCFDPPVPDFNLPPFPTEPTGDLTQRQRIEALTAPDICAECHANFGPIGFALQIYDAKGIYREQENGLPIDTASNWTFGWPGPDFGKSVFINDAIDVSQELGTNTQAQMCFAQRLTQHFLGYVDEDRSNCTRSDTQSVIASSGSSLKEVIATLVTSDQFLQRGGQQ